MIANFIEFIFASKTRGILIILGFTRWPDFWKEFMRTGNFAIFFVRRKNGEIFYRRCTGLSQDGSRHTC